MAQAEFYGVGGSGIGQFVHKGFDGEDIGEGTQSSERRVGHEVLDDAAASKGVERVGVAVDAAVEALAGAGCRWGQRVGEIAGGEQVGGTVDWPGAARMGVAPGVVIPIADLARGVEAGLGLDDHGGAISLPSVLVGTRPFEQHGAAGQGAG